MPFACRFSVSSVICQPSALNCSADQRKSGRLSGFSRTVRYGLLSFSVRLILIFRLSIVISCYFIRTEKRCFKLAENLARLTESAKVLLQ